jgi:hypothetical protein
VNVARPGLSGEATFTLLSLQFLGRTVGLGVPFVQWEQGALITNGSPNLQDLRQVVDGFVGPRTDVTIAGSASTPVARFSAAFDYSDWVVYNQDWFERVHLVPKSEVAFGNIITLEQSDYELFSAYRSATVTWTSATFNNVLPGVELSGVALPIARGPLSSWLDPSSTGNDAGTGLGTLVRYKVSATETGRPVFDGTIDFAFSSGDELSLEVSGTRIIFLPFEYESPLVEELAFLTDVIESLSGKEQRIALRQHPRQSFRVEYALDAEERQRMQVTLTDWMDRTFGFPLWHEAVKLTAAVTAGTTVYQVANADDCDFRVGGLAVVLTDNDVFDVLTIAGATATTITAADASVNAYPRGARLMPLRLARITGAVSGRRFIRNLETFQMEFEVTDNATGALTGSTTGWSSYNGRVLLDDCNAVDGTEIGHQFNRRLYVIDNQTGTVNTRSPWDRSKRSHQKGFVGRSRAEILKLRRLLLSIKGRQKAFYIPTFIEDLTPVATLTIGTSTLDIRNIEYTRFAQSRDPKNLFRITFTDGSTLLREITGSAKISSTVERLTLDATWPATRTVAEVSRIEFYELVRFDTDKFTLTYPRIGLASVQAPVRAVFDDV